MKSLTKGIFYVILFCAIVLTMITFSPFLFIRDILKNHPPKQPILKRAQNLAKKISEETPRIIQEYFCLLAIIIYQHSMGMIEKVKSNLWKIATFSFLLILWIAATLQNGNTNSIVTITNNLWLLISIITIIRILFDRRTVFFPAISTIIFITLLLPNIIAIITVGNSKISFSNTDIILIFGMGTINIVELALTISTKTKQKRRQ